jgi:D-alanyl-D-alanine carboxypeptidase
MNNMHFIFRTMLLMGISLPATAQSIDTAKLDAYFDALAANNKYMGSVAVSQNGKLIYTKTTGFADIASAKKADEATKYRIGSISKTFTTALIFKAVEAKKLTLSQPIATWFPSVKNAATITVGHLLSHRSGIHNFTDDSTYLSYNTKPKSRAEMLTLIARLDSDFAPGSRAAYSNANFVLLSYILETLHNKPYSQLLTEQITKPLGLTRTHFGGPIDLAANEANSYKFAGNWTKEPETDPSIPMGAGAIVSTPTELTRFAEALFGGKVVAENSLAQMKIIQDGYGTGLFQIPFGKRKSYGHTGGIDGFSSIFGYFPDDKIAFAATSNGSNYLNNDIYIALLSGVFGVPFSLPTFTTYTVSEADLAQYVGTYASPQIPLKITIAKTKEGLTAQATGQPAFPLEATEKDTFKFDKAGVVLEFTPATRQMVLKQGGGVYTFTRE